MSKEPSAIPETPSPPRWRGILAGLSLALGVVSCLACLVGNSFCIAAFVTGDFRYTGSEYGRLWFVGLVMWAIAFFCGALAILLGILARRALPRRDRLARGVRLAKAGIILGCIGTVATLLSAQILPILDPRVHAPRLFSCQNNLKQIGVILKMYALDNQGVLPDRLTRTYPEYASDLTVFVCPLSGHEPGDAAHIDDWSDYTYVSGLSMTETPADARALVCHDKSYTNHEPPGRNELYLDGHVEYRVNWEALPPSQTEY